MLQVRVGAAGSLCRQHSQGLDLGFNLEVTEFCPGGSSRGLPPPPRSAPQEMGTPRGTSASYCPRDMVNGLWVRGEGRRKHRPIGHLPVLKASTTTIIIIILGNLN